MNDSVIVRDWVLPEDMPRNEEFNNYAKVESDIINTLSENQFTISQARYMFNHILRQFERKMPITNHTKY